MTRVLIVEDSLTVRRYLAGIVQERTDMELVGEAENGQQAIEMTSALKPDVISLDMMLPIMTGLAATEYIMAYHPTPILIVSASTNRGELFRTYDALSAGAVDVLEKPGDLFDPGWPERYVSSLKRVSRIKAITHPRALLKQRRTAERVPGVSLAPSRPCRCAAIGASTGGPAAVAEILKALPPAFPVPLLLVIHIGPGFASAMAEWLDGVSPIPVVTARDGMPLPEGPGAALAPDTYHMIVAGGRLRLTSDPERHSCRPSVDVLFESVAKEFGRAAAGILLTGMGRDGARGLLKMREAGGMTIAQDEATSLIFGMPQEAVRLGAAAEVLPLDKVAAAIARLGMRGRAG